MNSQTLSGVARSEQRSNLLFDLAYSLPDSAGAFIDQLAGGTPVLLTTIDAGDFAQKLGTTLSPGLPHRIEQVELGTAELYALQAMIFEDVSDLQRAGIDVQTVGIDAKSNSVTVGVPIDSDQIGSALRARYGPHVQVREVGRLQGGDSACTTGTTRKSCWPLMGALKIYRTGTSDSDGQYCTTGAIVRDAGGDLFALTAGHCISINGGNGKGWAHSSTVWGISRWHTFSANAIAHAGIIEIDDEDYPPVANLFFASAYNDVRVVDGYEPVINDHQAVDDYVCRSGWVSLYMCGYIIDTDDLKKVDGVWIKHQWTVDFDACPGDSGGPYFLYNTIFGIHSDSTFDEPLDDCDPNVGIAWYSPMRWVLTAMSSTPYDITLCTDADC